MLSIPRLIIALVFLAIIAILDFKTDILKIKSKSKYNKLSVFFIGLIVLLSIEYIEDFITYNYFDDALKKDTPSLPYCEQRSAYDALLAGVSEEIVFRYIIFNLICLQYFKLGITKSIIISSLLFGIVHINQYLSFGVNIYNTLMVILQAIPAGAIFAYVYSQTNLTTAILLHFTVDFIDFLLLRCNKNLYKNILFIHA
uniref:CAAX prenyl protease 2/Lysostaphin resistance protein A-like domain-containing protein n=1 Tax=viral metagenome TaxID=1070528 RepID=A0A6C0FKY6_9ZZZZ|tara:strand:- start:704 stop:1300 length:597 start_codon:yes stop_codon:yes gene_type:complete